MKIGIVSIGNDSLELFRFLQKHDHEYHVYYDANAWPLGDKSTKAASSIVERAIAYLSALDVDWIILPPSWELSIDSSHAGYEKIIPLFRRYLFDYCFRFSLVGKIGLLCDPIEALLDDKTKKSLGQSLLNEISKSYVLGENQKAIAKFHFPFSYRSKDVRMWKYFLRSLQTRSYLVNKVVKFDLRYFRDAMVDTIVPFNYAFFAFEKTIKRYFNFKTQRFHDLSCLEACFANLVSDESDYEITIHMKGDKNMIMSRKRYVRLLQRGQGTAIDWKQIDD